MSTELMNPREYEDLLKKLRHLRAQEQSAEKTLTELRIEKATLIKENIERASHGQKQGIYDAAGVDRTAVQKDLRVKDMLSKGGTCHDLPGHRVLQSIAATSVPESVREKVLAQPDITYKEVQEMIKEAKGTATPSAPKRPDWHTMLSRFREMNQAEQEAFMSFANSDMAHGLDKHYATLGLLPSAHPAVVKATIRALQNLHHPDKGGDPVEFARIQEAAEAIQAD